MILTRGGMFCRQVVRLKSLIDGLFDLVGAGVIIDGIMVCREENRVSNC